MPDQGTAISTTAPLPPDRLLAEGRHACIAPWAHLAVATNGDLLPCCEATAPLGSLRTHDIATLWQSEAMEAFRATLRADRPDPRCAKCHKIERSGGRSHRQILNGQFAAHAGRIAQAGPVPPPVSLDIRFGNLCNLACRTCWHGSSSRWFADARRLGWTAGPEALVTAFPDTESGLAALRPLLPTVGWIYWAGGEPMMMEEHYRILEELIALGRRDVVLGYTTNGTTLRLGGRDVLALWPHFDEVTVELSADAAGARGELIRHGLDWDRFAATLAEIRARCPHVRIQFGIAVSVLNVAVVDALYQRLAALMEGAPFAIRLHPVQDPAHYSVRILPRAMKAAIAARLLAHAATIEAAERPVPGQQSASTQFRQLVAFMQAADESAVLPRFRAVTQKLDALRGQDTAATCPELAPLLHPPPSPAWRRGVDRLRQLSRRGLAALRR